MCGSLFAGALRELLIRMLRCSSDAAERHGSLSHAVSRGQNFPLRGDSTPIKFQDIPRLKLLHGMMITRIQ